MSLPFFDICRYWVYLIQHALLLSNVRATWLAKRLAGEQIAQQQAGPGTVATLQSVFSDVLLRVIWPIGRWIYYALTVLMFIGIMALLFCTPATSSL